MRRLIWLSCCPWLGAIATIESGAISSQGAAARPVSRGLSPSSTMNIGNETFAITPRIVGGDIVMSADAFPYYVHGVDGDLCGASLIHPEVVLTAAHCTKAFSTGVILRTLDWMGLDSTSEFYSIEYVFPHPDYTPGPETNDIMLIKLTTPVVNAQPVELYRNETVPPAGTLATIMGFGLTAEGGSISQDLQQVTLEIVDQSVCQMLLPGLVDPEIHLCAGLPEGEKDSCGGDSGGPLVDALDTNLQYGIVSFGIGCARPNLPGVYTRISSYIEWIDDFLCTQTNSPPLGCPANSNENSQLPSDMPSVNTLLLQSTSSPTASPSVLPSSFPSVAPSFMPSDLPSLMPSYGPSLVPTTLPSQLPSLAPSTVTSLAPSLRPTTLQKATPTVERMPGSPSVVSDLLDGSPASSSSVHSYAIFGWSILVLFIYCG